VKLSEAIELANKDIDNPGSVAIEDINEAEKLLIEAGKREVYNRKHQPFLVSGKLPGETNE